MCAKSARKHVTQAVDEACETFEDYVLRAKFIEGYLDTIVVELQTKKSIRFDAARKQGHDKALPIACHLQLQTT